jgi:L-lactate dehydrogenase (cytochrome)
VRTDLDSFSDAEACALMCDGYLMTERALQSEGQPLGFALSPVQRERWRFLEIEPLLRTAGQGNPLLRQLAAGDKQFFKIWSLSTTLKWIGAALGLALLAALAWLISWSWSKELLSLSVGQLVLLAGGLALSLLGLGWISKVINYRKTLEQVLVGIGLVGVGAFVARLHLHLFDQLFLRQGRLDRLRSRTRSAIQSIADLRERARQRLPKAVFDFVDGGAQDEISLHANRADFERLRLMPRALTDVSRREVGTTLLGQPVSLPLVIAPTGLAGLLWPKGEVEEARAAQAAGIPYCLSMMAASSIEEVARATRQPLWFQLYLLKDRSLAQALVDRARAAGSRVLVVTVDTKAQGPRERDIRNGFTVPPRVTPANVLDVLRRPQWLRRVALGPRVTFANLAGSLVQSRDIISIARFAAEQYDFTVNWSDIDWCRAMWSGPLVLKGVLTPEDAALAVEHGADAVIVSNHGGRQLDGSPSAIAALPAIVDEVQGRAEIILDGGVRRGTDIVKALALGARACMAGRPFLYGLAADGQAGVARAIDIFRNELDVSLALLGRSGVQELDESAITSH